MKAQADFCTSEKSKNQPSLLKKKAAGQAFRSAEVQVQKFAGEFSHGLNFNFCFFWPLHMP